ncbi:hypothetical protein CHS0354_023741 [Potamilus streckersoni]|uniref:peptidylprolyl isomerase n=1 Tax=Potamilus streckersoni TaxID=2493646 RepID=A0AAE0RZI8_9BIVA|nr:hypothetical protein CHS0354_023741 [Potamilus streckersoni]
MDYKISNNVQTRLSIEFTFDLHEYNSKLQVELNNIQKGTTLKGFRPGKAPASLISKYFRDEAISKILVDLTQVHFSEILEKNKFVVLTKPVIHQFVETKNQAISVTIDMDILPEFDIDSNERLTLSRNRYLVTDQDVTSQLNDLTKNYGTWESTDEAAQIDEHGKDAFLTTQLLGIKRNEVRDVHVPVGSNLSGQAVSSQESFMRIKVNEVKKHIPYPLDDSFATEFSKNKFSTLKELEEYFFKLLQDKASNRSESELREQIITTMLNKYTFEVPSSITKIQEAIEYAEAEAQLKSYGLSLKDGVSNELKEAINQKVHRASAWVTFCTRYAMDNSIENNEEDFANYFKMISMAENSTVDVVKKRHENSELLSFLAREFICSTKVISAILSKAEVREHELPFSHKHN